MPSDSVQTISNGAITLSLYADSTFSLQFGETDYSLRRMRATASIGGSEVSPIGPWLIDGNTARCGGENGTPIIEIAIDEEQPGACSMLVSVSPLVESVLDRFTITGAATGEFETRLVEGYDSWSWALDCLESVRCAFCRTIICPLNTACALPPTMHLCICRLTA